MTERRILVAIDTSPLSLEALRAGARLARAWNAELHGLFVEDINLLHMAAHPAVKAYDSRLARCAPIDPGAMEHALGIQLATARRLFNEIARAMELRSASFSVKRGRVNAEILAAAANADILCLGSTTKTAYRRAARASGGYANLGSLARAAIYETSRSVLVLRESLVQSPHITLLLDESPGAERALSLAAELAESDGMSLRVLLAAADPEKSMALQKLAETKLAEAGVTPLFQTLPPTPLDVVEKALRTLSGGVLVVADDTALLGAKPRELLEGLSCSVLLVR